MKYLELTFPTPAANLACDEALLDWCEAGEGEPLLRVWEAHAPFVVVGYANQAAREVDLATCQKQSVPVLRRCSGGGTVIQGPGCLNYALLLQIEVAAALATIPGTNCWIMEKHRNLFAELLHAEVRVQGHTDLTLGERKFSGNAQRRKRQWLLFHGTFLLEFDLSLIDHLLPLPSRQPAYRAHRRHTEFLCNAAVSTDRVKAALRELWQANEPLQTWPEDTVQQLVAEKYSRAEWNLRC